ncbi:LOG family protein ORF6 in fasciation locus [Aquisphaera giovannonii]|uniref:Cytokinin riboside 5'-monophosphate phosphoribohydrolase n=1 Tax=Aquisphaera giovannonii TaxID=406548 RepID=A0A5B9WAI1_9BACT|nr:TIGR00730 family Rossman fold protein [Aquisphaera giovannonii]QEH36880.1 LOG family protein ORF6 in fasciation locus [Aquisphaera giovannonii]
MSESSSLCVFCGSSAGHSPSFAEAARLIGEAIVRNRAMLVYGGGRVGLMGIVADAVLSAGGRAVGVIPEALATKEIAHDGLSELHVVAGMHERKALMAARSSAFLALPGGIGTFEEFFEILSWQALGIHSKPIGLLNVGGYFDPLLSLLDHGIASRFIRPAHLRPLVVSDQAEAIVRKLLGHEDVVTPTPWLSLDQS